jgi:phosphatidylglycerophosphate synthase
MENDCHNVIVADSKRANSLLTPVERRIIPLLVQRVPCWVHSHHLTLLTLLWSVLMLIAAVGARADAQWLWAMSALIVFQYVTDAIDGKIGKDRNEGLVRWGYYMDHLLDYVFLSSILIGYTILLPPHLQFLMVPALAVAAGFMVSSFLARTVTGVLTISYGSIGPIEVRLIFIAINVSLATVGQPSPLAWGDRPQPIYRVNANPTVTRTGMLSTPATPTCASTKSPLAFRTPKAIVGPPPTYAVSPWTRPEANIPNDPPPTYGRQPLTKIGARHSTSKSAPNANDSPIPKLIPGLKARPAQVGVSM